MQSTQTSKAQRHRAILDLIEAHYVHSQAELQELLDDQGLAVNQATLSRDLRELGVVKGPDGYEFPSAPTADPMSGPAALGSAVKMWLTSKVVAQNQVLLKTPPGGAQPLAIALDRAELQHCLGTIAGDDTVLAICKNHNGAAHLAAELEGLKR